jgi:archaemetzincin
MNAGPNSIHVAPLGRVSPDCVAPVGAKLAEVFHADVQLFPIRLDANTGFDRTRNQYSSSIILESLLGLLPAGGGKLIGITNFDLFVPIFTYVFGEAQLNGSVALASSFRLRNELYGLPADADLLRERVIKEAVHEIGHTFGLVHCNNPRCVMRVSTAVEEVDLKRADLCPRCREQMLQS